jgi:hypothetical protein
MAPMVASMKIGGNIWRNRIEGGELGQEMGNGL